MAAALLSSDQLSWLRNAFNPTSKPASKSEKSGTVPRAPEESHAVTAGGAPKEIDISDVPPLSQPSAASNSSGSSSIHDVPVHPGLFKHYEPLQIAAVHFENGQETERYNMFY